MLMVKLEVGETFFFSLEVFLACTRSYYPSLSFVNVEGVLGEKCCVKYKFSINISECVELLLRETFDI